MRLLLMLLIVVLATFSLVTSWDAALQLIFLTAVMWWLFRPVGLFRRRQGIRR